MECFQWLNKEDCQVSDCYHMDRELIERCASEQKQQPKFYFEWVIGSPKLLSAFLLPNDSPIFLTNFFSSKKLFSFSRYSRFVFPSFTLFLQVALAWEIDQRKILKLMTLFTKPEFKNILFDILRRKVGLLLKHGQLIEY